VAEDQMKDNPKLKCWVGYGGPSDHLPILLKLENEGWKPLAPFKFNHSWLNEEDFRDLVKGIQRLFYSSLGDLAMNKFVDNMKKVKRDDR
jgi:hypothetical protein